MAIVVTLAMALVLPLGMFALAAALQAHLQQRHDTALLASAEATIAALARYARDGSPSDSRAVLARYQLLPGVQATRLTDAQGRTLAQFALDGRDAGNQQVLDAPTIRRASWQALSDGWSLTGLAPKRLWMPVGWQGFTGWLAIDRDLLHLKALRARIVAWTMVLLLAIYGAIIAGLWWLGQGQHRALDALRAFVDRGARGVYPSPRRYRAPIELWAFADSVREAWKHLKHNQREVEIAGKRNDELFQSHHDPAFIIDEHGQIIVANKRASQVFGYGPTEFIGMHADQLVSDASMGDYREWWKEYWRTGTAPRQDRPLRVRSLRKNRREFEAELALVQIRGGDGCEFAVTYRDIGERLANDAKLTSAMAAADEASRTRSTFVATVGNEFRVPINSIISMAELGLANEPTPAHAEYLRTIRAGARRLAASVDDILDLSRMESGRLELEARPFNVKLVFEEVRAVYEPVARHKGIKFDLRLDSALPEAVIGDGVRIRQIVDNVLVNAFRFTDKGYVSIRCSAVAASSVRVNEPGVRSALELKIEIEDTGIGIPKNRLDAIFEPFAQAESSTARQFGGNGLGLSLSRRLAQHMGGAIWAESVEGKGSTFHIEIPCVPATAHEAQVTRNALQEGVAGVEKDILSVRHGALRAIVVDESQQAREVLEHALSAQGFRVEVCADAHKAFDAWRIKPAEIVIGNLASIEVGEFNLALELRQSETNMRGGRRVLFIGVSDNINEQVQSDCRRWGLDACWSLPLRSDAIAEQVDVLLGEGNGPAQNAVRLERREATLPSSAQSNRAQGWGFSSNGDPKLMQRILKLALKDIPDRMRQLHEANEQNDVQWIQRHAHSLVNSLVAIGQMEIADQARSVEAKAHQGVEALAPILAQLVQSVDDMLPALEEQLAQAESAAQAPA